MHPTTCVGSVAGALQSYWTILESLWRRQPVADSRPALPGCLPASISEVSHSGDFGHPGTRIGAQPEGR